MKPTSKSLTPVARETSAEVTFLISANHGVWTVTNNDEFYGDYLKEEHARASAQCAVAAILAEGGAAKAWLFPDPVADEEMIPVPIALDVVGCDRPSRYPVPDVL